MNIATFLDRQARQTPEAAAIWRGATLHSGYAAFAATAASIAGFIEGLQIAPGDRVAMFMTNGTGFLEVLQAIIRTGAVAVPVNAKLHGVELGVILASSRARLLFVDHKTASSAEIACRTLPAPICVIDIDDAEFRIARQHEPAAVRERSADDLAWLFFTSGTTGRPKGAMLTHRNLMLMSASYLLEVDGVAPGDTLLHAAPMSHGSGMYIFPHIMRGASQLVCESPAFDEDEVISMCGQHTGVSFFAAPTMVQRLMRSSAMEGSETAERMRRGLKLIVYGGGPMLLSVARDARSMFGDRLAQIYGQGECPMTISRLQRTAFGAPDTPATDRLLSSVGQPFDLVEVRIDGAEGPGNSGEILVKSDIVMAGYWKDPEATAAAVVDGWLRTGDVGYLDEDGNLHLSDRSKDVIVSGGTNIYPREVEDVIIRHTSIREVAVIGRPSHEWGEDVVAFISLNGDAAFDDHALDAHCLAHLARFKRPKAYHVLGDLPKNAYGKIEKVALRRLLTNTG